MLNLHDLKYKHKLNVFLEDLLWVSKLITKKIYLHNINMFYTHETTFLRGFHTTVLINLVNLYASSKELKELTWILLQ